VSRASGGAPRAKGGTVVCSIGEVDQVQALTRMALYRIQAGPDPTPTSYLDWPR